MVFSATMSGRKDDASSGVLSDPLRRPMLTNKRVLIIGFDPKFLDFSSPELAPMNLTAEKVNVGTAAEINRLRGL
jgi:hypothetical protein